jgi:amino acid adenylation domain-containing protein
MTRMSPPPPPIQRYQLKQASLSFSQESLWFLQQLDPENTAYNMLFLQKLSGGIDTPSLERALNEMVRRHIPLRTGYPNQGGRPLQVIQPFEPLSLPYVDYSGLSEEEQQLAIHRYVSEHGDQPYDLQRGPLVRFALLHSGPKEDYLFFGTHHISFDAWSQEIFFSELTQLYDAFRSGKEPALLELPVQYTDYALWQRKWLSGETLEAYIEHWKNILAGDLPILELPTDRPRPVLQSFRGARYRFQISGGISSQMREFCQRQRMTPFQLFLAAYAIMLMRYSGQEDIILGCPFANRSRPELDGLVGLFVNTLPIRVNLRGNPSVREFLKQVHEVMLETYPWQAAPFETLVSEFSPERDLSRTPVFQVLINMRNVPKRLCTIEGLEVENVLLDNATAAFDISLELGDEGDHFSAAMRYNTSLFDQTTILQMVSHFQNILSAILERSEWPISELEMLGSSERQRLLMDWNETQSEYRQQCVHELISEQAAKNPDALAIICNGRQLTYSALERKANQLASYLLAEGVKSGTLVGIFLPRSEDLIVTQLAILKAGGAYVPFDPTFPEERLAYMLEDTNPALVITHSSLEAQIPDKFQNICLDSNAGAIQASPSQTEFAGTDLDSLIYITYTSGSTGRPKGVMNIQRGSLNYLHHLVKTFHLKSGERVIQFTPLSFDLSFRDTLGVLTFGGTLVLMDDEQMRDPNIINNAIIEQRITCILSVVPTMLRALASSDFESKARENHLRLVMPSGEALHSSDIELLRNAFGKVVQIVNQYGPTECSMISTLYLVPAELQEGVQDVPIGKPISNIRAYVLDQNRQPVPVGVRGELYIGGVGVGPGYLNQPVLTKERFIPDPFQASGRMYRSGDLVRYSPDGNLTYLGRLDHQVKIRGYRVELGEIEAVMNEVPGVKDAVVVFWNQNGAETLAAYITVVEGHQEQVKDNLHQYLKDRLPFYMLPSSISVLKEMPLTPNRKIDRCALPHPEIRESPEHYLAPRNDVEIRLVSIWKEVLDAERVGVKDNFFEIGGHSLLAVRLCARIQEEFGQSLPLVLLFKDGTVEALAVALSQRDDSPSVEVSIPFQVEGSQPPFYGSYNGISIPSKKKGKDIEHDQDSRSSPSYPTSPAQRSQPVIFPGKFVVPATARPGKYRL